MERGGVMRITDHRDPNEVAIAYDAVRWIEIDPTGSGQIDLGPGVGVTAAGIAFIVTRDVQISGDETCGHAERADRIDHQHCEVTTASASELKRPQRGLDALLIPAHVLEGPVDFMSEVDKKLAGIEVPIFSQKCTRPLIDKMFRIERLSFHEPEQVGHLMRGVAEWNGIGALVDLEVVDPDWRMLKADGAGEPKLFGARGEAHDAHVVLERVARQSNVDRSWGNLQLFFEEPLVMAVAGAQHHRMLA